VLIPFSLLQGDGVHDTASLLPELVDAGLRVLIYSGEADMRECKRLRPGLSTHVT
jgi:hypothetical protein